MPIKKDGTGKRWVEMELIVPGTPEQIWQAMATGDGNTAWFTKTTIEEHIGGKVRFEFAPGMGSSGEVTLWQPPNRFAYVEREWNGNAPPIATEITISARSGGKCLVRMVHSLFSSTDDWDDQMEGFEGGWPGFFEVLKLYVAHFAGLKGAAFMAMSNVGDEPLSVWTRLMSELGLTGANVAESRTSSATPQSLSGIVERVQQDAKQRWIVVRLLQPNPGIAIIGLYEMGDGVNVSASLYFYGDDAAATAQASEQLWRNWLSTAFPSRTVPNLC
jgi:uncharacterized protein YndB with AHSA1/START domain